MTDNTTTEDDSIAVIVDQHDELLDEARTTISEATERLAELIADAYGYDTGDVSVQHMHGHHFTATIDDSDHRNELSDHLPDDYQLSTTVTLEIGEFKSDEPTSSYAQRQRIKEIKDLIETLEFDYGGVSEDEFKLRAQRRLDISPDKIEDELENLRRKGEIYETDDGSLRTT